VWARPGEVVFYEDDRVAVVRTKDMKGHRERIMVVVKRHSREVPEAEARYAIRRLVEVGRRVFDGDFLILEDTHSRWRDHWHRVSSKLDPAAEDYDLILKTEFTVVKGEGG